ncbi:MAG: CPBP family intramembrane metalloprotease, partial [Acidobacteriota bacterium]|nr:CPBP family intramembrane metalloprotease [Acidobacteriota bacterium]
FTPDSLLALFVPFTIFATLAIFLGWLYGKIFEDLPFRALGFWVTKNWLKDLLAGCVLGAASLGFASLLAAIFGGVDFRFNETAGATPIILTLGVSLALFIAGAIFEEAFFRGYMLQTLARAKLFWVGLIITSFLFASAHNDNPSANFLSWLNTFIAGVWFAVAYYKTRNLWFPFGLHLMWNWFQGAILGINVSGLQRIAPAPVLQASDAGPDWLTGGEYGLEGGVACTIALIFSTALIYFLPLLKPTEEMLALTSEEKPRESKK